MNIKCLLIFTFKNDLDPISSKIKPVLAVTGIYYHTKFKHDLYYILQNKYYQVVNLLEQQL